MDPIIIIGTGMAGYTLARELRKLDKDSPLVLVTGDDGRSYSKPMLSNALAAGKTPEALAMAGAEQMATQLKATIRTRSRVTAIDTASHIVIVDGEAMTYRKLVLALGADPLRPRLEGTGAEDVMSVNDLADYGRFRAAIGGKARVAILGGGLIGCEFANDLRAAGYAVDVIHPAAQPLDRLVPASVGGQVARALAGMGVTWHFGVAGNLVDRIPGGYRVGLSDGTGVEADAVLSAIGLRPRIELAAAAGLKTGRGIVVDGLLQTSAPDIYALGDCAEVNGLVLPYVMPIMQGARALARTLAGEATQVVYPIMPVVVKTPACPVVAVPPVPGAAGRWEEEVGPEGVAARFLDEAAKSLGFALAGAAVAEKSALLKEMG